MRASGKTRGMCAARIVPLALAACGLALLAAPVLVAHVRQYAQQAGNEAWVTSVATSEQAERVLRQARAYNEQLAGGDVDDVLPYDEQLALPGSDGVIARVVIESAGIDLAVRKGTSQAVLAAGAGHLASSALPVGGSGCTCVLAAHSGLAAAHMFDGLRRVDEGALVELSCAGQTLSYAVVSVQVVAPDALEGACEALAGHDRLVLFTCTGEPNALFARGAPGLTSMRLVVTCERADDAADMDAQVEGNEGAYDVVLTAALVLCAVGVAVGMCARLRARRKRTVAHAMSRAAHKTEANTMERGLQAATRRKER